MTDLKDLVAQLSGKTKADTLYSIRDFGNTNILLSLEKVLDYLDVPLFDAAAAREAVIPCFPTGWKPGQTIDGFFRGDSIPVNDELSRIFIQLHLSRQPFDFRENSLLVTVPACWALDIRRFRTSGLIERVLEALGIAFGKNLIAEYFRCKLKVRNNLIGAET